MLWLCIDLPWLPVEVFALGAADQAVAVADGGRVLTANAAAQAAGVGPGLKLSAAHALLPTLVVRERDGRQEQQALRRLAGWALQFTSLVSLQPPRALLLEVGGSLNYFGSLERIRAAVSAGVEALGYGAVISVAPTPSAAWLLALGGDTRPVGPGESLDRRLSGLPVAVLPLEARTLEALHGLGVKTLGDCLHLPRAGLARRVGRDVLRLLDRARGRESEPREGYRPPLRFVSALELPAEVHDAGQLEFAGNRLLRELCGYLHGTGTGVQRLRLSVRHADLQPTVIPIGLAHPSRDPERLLAVVRERLAREQLPAPALGLRLAAPRLLTLDPSHHSLLEDEAGADGQRWGVLVERLAARLGEPQVRGLGGRAEHRPERAWRYRCPGERAAVAAERDRPLWLLPQPQRLSVEANQPAWNGPLHLEQGPERIETGWWDGADVSRDYYVARNPRGERLWIFQERRDRRQWFLHGVFA